MAIAERSLRLGLRLDIRALDQPALGKKLTELRARYRWSQKGLAAESDTTPPTIAAIETGYGQRELERWKDDPSHEPKPYETSPKVLRKIAHALAAGRDLAEKEAVYAELMEAAGWLPQGPSLVPLTEAAEHLAQMQERYLALSRAMEECERIIREASA